MFYREAVTNDELKKYLNGKESFWNISGNVGWGCENNWVDVMFVQYLLSAAWDLDILVCDGIFGPKTAAAIKKFQKGSSGEMKADGRINTVDGTRLYSTVSNTIYTIFKLNSEMIKFLPLTFFDLKGDHRFPLKLKAFLSGKSSYISPFSVQTMIN